MNPNVVVIETKKRLQSRTWVYTLATILGVIITALMADDNVKELLGGYAVVLYVADKIITMYFRETTDKAIGDGKPKLNPVDKELRKELEEQGLV